MQFYPKSSVMLYQGDEYGGDETVHHELRIRDLVPFNIHLRHCPNPDCQGKDCMVEDDRAGSTYCNLCGMETGGFICDEEEQRIFEEDDQETKDSKKRTGDVETEEVYEQMLNEWLSNTSTTSTSTSTDPVGLKRKQPSYGDRFTHELNNICDNRHYNKDLQMLALAVGKKCMNSKYVGSFKHYPLDVFAKATLYIANKSLNGPIRWKELVGADFDAEKGMKHLVNLISQHKLYVKANMSTSGHAQQEQPTSFKSSLSGILPALHDRLQLPLKLLHIAENIGHIIIDNCIGIQPKIDSIAAVALYLAIYAQRCLRGTSDTRVTCDLPSIDQVANITCVTKATIKSIGSKFLSYLPTEYLCREGEEECQGWEACDFK